MKHTKTVLSLLLIAGLGCNSDSDVTNPIDGQGPEIRFGSKIITITKAIIEENTLPDDAQIGIFGWGHPRSKPGENTTIRNDLNNALYKKVSNTNELYSESHAHFPVSPDTLINIYAYYPYQETATANPLSIPINLDKQNDLMWATPVTGLDKTSDGKTVELLFNHLLSAITIKIKKADDIKEDMILQSVSLENYSSTAQFNVQTGKLTLPVATAPFLIKAVDNETITPEVTTVCTNTLLCPTDKPVFIIRLSGNDFRIPSTTAFLANRKQTYEFTIQAADIVLSGTIKPWEDGGTSNETIYF